MIASPIPTIAEAILESPGGAPDFETACRLAEYAGTRPVEFFAYAEKIRERYRGKCVFPCAIVNAKSGHCSQDCAFCAQSAHHHTGVATYPLLDEATMVKSAREMAAAGAVRFSMVTSGKAITDAELAVVCRTARTIRETVGIHVCASLGLLTPERARRLAESGITRYHHNLETARSFFPQICTTHDYEADLDTIRMARAAGMSVCAGGILGMGENWAQRVELAITLRELAVDAVPLNFLNPIPGTRLEGRPLLSPMAALRSIALFRFLLPDKEILVCGGREKTLQDLQSWIFFAGASGLMVGNYLTTLGRNVADDMKMIRDLELTRASAAGPRDSQPPAEEET